MTLTTEQLDWIAEGKNVYPVVTVSDTTPSLVITGADILIDSMAFDYSGSTGSGYQPGHVEASELTFTLDNHDGRFNDVSFEGKTIFVQLDIAGVLIPYGTYIVDVKPIMGDTIEIRALDFIARLAQPIPTSRLPQLAGLTVSQLLTTILNEHGINLFNTTFPNSTYVPTLTEEIGSMTAHELVQWLVGLTGGVGRMTQEASPRFQIVWPNDPDNMTITTLDIPTRVEVAQTDVKFSGVETEINGERHLEGSKLNDVLMLGANPLLSNAEPLGALLTAVSDKNIRPVHQIDYFGLPNIFPMSKVVVTLRDGSTYNTLVLSHRYVLNSRSTIQANWELESRSGYASMSPISPEQRVAILNAVRAVTAQNLSSVEEATLALNAQIANALGYYETVIEQPNGAKITYTHDQPTLEASTYISTTTEQGYAYTNTGWNDGDPVWQYGVTSEGSLIMRMISTVGLNADWITVGRLNPDLIYFGDQSLEDAFYELGRQVSALESGGGNLIVNSNLGTGENPSGEWWSYGVTYRESRLRKLTYGALAGATYQMFREGSV